MLSFFEGPSKHQDIGYPFDQDLRMSNVFVGAPCCCVYFKGVQDFEFETSPQDTKKIFPTRKQIEKNSIVINVMGHPEFVI